ncbi:MAG TPA: hypothetical protein VKH34_06220 [Vicinamibacterales bacterium]|jgi:hypothetical protein|nr:hypothetical protein [Vicinamibacterales bacterium]
MVNRWSAAVFVVGILAGYALSAPAATAQSPALPFVVGDTVTLSLDKNGPVSQVSCRVGLVRGDYVRCDPRESDFITEPRENWWNLKSVVHIVKTQAPR